jgi:hypothetical protein
VKDIGLKAKWFRELPVLAELKKILSARRSAFTSFTFQVKDDILQVEYKQGRVTGWR